MFCFLGKNSSSFSGKKFNSSFQTSGKLESKKRSPVNPKIKTNGMLVIKVLCPFYCLFKLAMTRHFASCERTFKTSVKALLCFCVIVFCWLDLSV